MFIATFVIDSGECRQPLLRSM
uniref:Uncharacterized protein n=1 Tax=Anguilla anguilla TaxID=7936 RepID=A0A0E9VJM7_ANGAN